jgi:uncharacterized protein YjdB
VLATVVTVVTACGDGKGPAAPVPVALVTLSTNVATVVPVQTLQLTATVKDAAGNALSGRGVSWASSDESRVRVGATGLLTGVAAGAAQITATSEGKTAHADITVRDGGLIVPTGGTVSAANGAVTLAVPPGAISQATPVTVDAAASAGQDPRIVAGAAFEFGPNGTTFAQPVRLTLKYSPSGISNGSPELALKLHRAVGSGWQEVAGSTVDIAAKAVAAPISSFSTYAVLGRHAVDRVTISIPGAPVTVGGTVQLSATVLDAAGNPLGDRTVAWLSMNPTIASVDANGLVRGESPGTATITATVEGKSSAVQVTVIPAGISLAVGESRTLTASEAGRIEISGGSAGAEFVLVPFHGSRTAAATVALEFNATNISGVTGPPLPHIAPASPGELLVAGSVSFRGDAGAARFDTELRRLERDLFASRMPSARMKRSLRPSASASGSGSLAAVPAVGDVVTYNTSRTSCTGADPRTGRVVAVSTRAVIVADNANPAGGFTDAEYADIGTQFDNFVYPLMAQTFGTPVDIDANGSRSIIFYTRAVNELTPAGSQSVIGGFFHPRDLFPKTAPNPNDACPTSNEAEMFYMLVPDPNGEVNANVRTKESVLRVTVGVLGHEFQHLINASRRIYVNNATSFEEVWLNEGLSHIAEELMFYNASGLAPRQNITLTTLRSSPTILNAVNAYQVSNLGRLIQYLEGPEARSPYASDDELATRGATWQLLRYAADRSTTAQQTLWFNLANSRNAGITNFTAVFGGDFLSLVRDWATAQYTDDAVTTPGVHQHPSWHFRSILPVLINSTSPPPYPLETRSLTAGTTASLTLRGGSPAYLRFGVPGGATGSITSTSSGAALPGAVSATLVRTR